MIKLYRILFCCLMGYHAIQLTMLEPSPFVGKAEIKKVEMRFLKKLKKKSSEVKIVFLDNLNESNGLTPQEKNQIKWMTIKNPQLFRQFLMWWPAFLDLEKKLKIDANPCCIDPLSMNHQQALSVIISLIAHKSSNEKGEPNEDGECFISQHELNDMLRDFFQIGKEYKQYANNEKITSMRQPQKKYVRKKVKNKKEIVNDGTWY
jgi:hypothetical protein